MFLPPCEASLSSCYLAEPFTARFRVPVALEGCDLRLCVRYPSGLGEALPFEARDGSNGRIHFATLLPAEAGTLEFFASASTAGGVVRGPSRFVNVLLPRQEDWQQRPTFDQVTEGLWVGNARAALEAERHGFTRVLNVADQFYFSHPSPRYLHIPLEDWASNRIPDDHIREAVAWLRRQIEAGHRTLVTCRAGIGRSGSMAIAYLYATRTDLNFHQVVHRARHGSGFIPGKVRIYPHLGLEESLARLYPGRRPPTTRLEAVLLEDYAPREVIRVVCHEPRRVRARVIAEGRVPPFVFLHGDVFGEVADIPMTFIGQDRYEAVLVAHSPGRRWVTVRASNYLAETPFYEPQVWWGNPGEDLVVEAAAQGAAPTSGLGA